MAGKEKKIEAEMPETEPELEPEAELAAEPEPETPTPHEGKWVSDLAPGDIFPLGSERYRLEKMDGETAMVVLLKTRKQEVAPKKFVKVDIGAERLEMPGDTEIE